MRVAPLNWTNYNIAICKNMGAHMKTTIEISDALFITAKHHAAKRGVTLRALLEHGLRQTLKEAHPAPVHQPRDGRVKGRGLTAEARNAGWNAVLDAANQR